MRRPKTHIQRAEKLASQQHAAINRRQALEAGLTPRQIDKLRHQGRWHRVTKSVYVIAGSPDTWECKAAVAWLAGPSGTVISHLTAELVAAWDGGGRDDVTDRILEEASLLVADTA